MVSASLGLQVLHLLQEKNFLTSSDLSAEKPSVKAAVPTGPEDQDHRPPTWGSHPRRYSLRATSLNFPLYVTMIEPCRTESRAQSGPCRQSLARGQFSLCARNQSRRHSLELTSARSLAEGCQQPTPRLSSTPTRMTSSSASGTRRQIRSSANTPQARSKP